MAKKKYSAPAVHFRSIMLNERIAGICWGLAQGHVTKHAYWDPDLGSTPGYVEIWFTQTTSGGCNQALAGGAPFFQVTIHGDGDGYSNWQAVVNELVKRAGQTGTAFGKEISFVQPPS